MKMQDLISCNSLKGAEQIVAIKNPEMPVTGINILEATDIERWGKPGMIILTSYFALQSHSEAELKSFFEKLKRLGIACLIIKVNRLVTEIPALFIRLCESYAIPLIRISGETKYEDIIVEVLTFILGIREQRLALYYKVSKISSEMTLQMLSLHDILDRFKSFLGFDLTLIQEGKRATISTNKQLGKFATDEMLGFFNSEYMTFDYKRFHCRNEQSFHQKNPSVVLVDFFVNEETCETLAIHETAEHKIDEDDIVVVENLIRCLQLNLLRDYSGKQKIMWDKNTLVNDLLRGLISDREEFKSACATLEIDPEGECQVLTLNYCSSEEDDQIALYELQSRIRNEIRGIDRRIVYYTTPRYDQYILPFSKQQPACFDAAAIKASVDWIIEGDKFADRIGYSGGLSDAFSVSDISIAALQSKSVADFLTQNNISNNIRAYKNLGIFKLFLGNDKTNMIDFVPEELARLKKESPELFTTLRVYMKNNRNFKQTADELFLHPKTVKYRIDKITRDFQLDLENIHFVTMLLASIEILEFQDSTANIN